jgi:spore germination cell wall hydrolase CwlJ-like protein
LSSKVRTPAATRALIATLLGGAILGLATGAVGVAGAQPSADQARVQALGRAAEAGYAAAHAAPTPGPSSAPPAVALQKPARATIRRRLAARAGDLDCLASAVYYEARGESLAGRAAVAQVVLNRVGARAFAKSVCGVVFQGRADGECQFSFACNGAMREPREWAAWADARTVAARALAGYVMTVVGAANAFHGTHGGPLLEGRVRLGGHVFYRI